MSVDRTLSIYNTNLRYRWLDGREYECGNAIGCWGLLVKALDGCSKRLDVTIVIRDENGNWLVNDNPIARACMPTGDRPNTRPGTGLTR
mgnify:CR=1 FL=1